MGFTEQIIAGFTEYFHERFNSARVKNQQGVLRIDFAMEKRVDNGSRLFACFQRREASIYR